MRRAVQAPFILAVSPSPRGFAFVLFEGPTTPFDWGIKDLRGPKKNERSLAAIKRLVRLYHPAVLVIDDPDAKGVRRGKRTRSLLRALASFAAAERIRTGKYTKLEVRRAISLAGSHTKAELAKEVASRVEALATRLPPPRKIWMSEDPRQSLFDAAALGLTFFSRPSTSRLSPDAAE